jgi:hypothetical protein
MFCVEDETGAYSETCDVDECEEMSNKVEEVVVVKDEIPEDITFTPIKSEREVRLWGVCVS